MTTSQETGGAPGWLDMSRYPDVDPDSVLTPDEQGLLSSSLAVDDTALPDSVWEHMLLTVTGDDPGADLPDDPATDPSLDDPSVDDVDHLGASWLDEPGLDDHGLPADHGDYTDPTDHTDHGWGGGPT